MTTLANYASTSYPFVLRTIYVYVVSNSFDRAAEFFKKHFNTPLNIDCKYELVRCVSTNDIQLASYRKCQIFFIDDWYNSKECMDLFDECVNLRVKRVEINDNW